MSRNNATLCTDASAPPTDGGVRLQGMKGFTLVELLISIFIVLVLMVGINWIFGTASRTISVGNALMNANRDLRSSLKVAKDDFGAAVNAEDMPSLIIHSEEFLAFQNKLDRLTDSDGNPATYDADGDTSNGEEVDVTSAQYVSQINHRRHRADRISFFARHHSEYTRQTGNTTSYVGPQTSDEAWIHYGHLRLGNSAGDPAAFVAPAAGQNASDWVLGRNVILMSPASRKPLAPTGSVDALTWDSQADLARPAPYPSGRWRIQDSRVDLAWLSIGDEWTRMRSLTQGTNPYAAMPSWLEPTGMNYLFAGKTTTDRVGTVIPPMSTEMAMVAPVFLVGCTQFVIEFAGDFYEQTDNEMVGVLDYDDVPVAQGGGTRMRWYGMPRYVYATPTDPPDVRPISVPPVGGTKADRRWLNPDFAGPAPIQIVPITERTAGTARVWGWGPFDNQTERPKAATTTDPVKLGHPYAVRPSLIRITVEVTDTNSRLSSGQKLEMTFRIPS